MFIRFRGEFNRPGYVKWFIDDVVLHSDTSVLHIESDPVLPSQFTLHQNYPNPFNPLTKIGIGVPEQSQVKVTVYDLMGREVKMLFFGQLEPGYRHVVWNGKDEKGLDVSSGVYFVVMEGRGVSQSFRDMKKMMLLK